LFPHPARINGRAQAIAITEKTHPPRLRCRPRIRPKCLRVFSCQLGCSFLPLCQSHHKRRLSGRAAAASIHCCYLRITNQSPKARDPYPHAPLVPALYPHAS
jgi:hypothetical protein